MDSAFFLYFLFIIQYSISRFVLRSPSVLSLVAGSSFLSLCQLLYITLLSPIHPLPLPHWVGGWVGWREGLGLIFRFCSLCLGPTPPWVVTPCLDPTMASTRLWAKLARPSSPMTSTEHNHLQTLPKTTKYKEGRKSRDVNDTKIQKEKRANQNPNLQLIQVIHI